MEIVGRAPRLRQLAGFVDRLWYVADRDSNGWELKLPTSSAQVIINLDAERLSSRSVRTDGRLCCGGVGLTSISARAELLDRAEQRRTAGVVIRPEAVGALIGGSAESLEALVNLDEVVRYGSERLATAAAAGRSGAEVLDFLERELADLVHDRSAPDLGCRRAIALLRSGRPVAEVSDRLGISQSTLVRRFRQVVGLTPKRFYRLVRLERAVGLAASESSPDWSTIAVRSGCYDQAHLVHEFSELTGLTPARWHVAGAESPFHVRLDDDFLQDLVPLGRHDGDHERRSIPGCDTVPALSRR